MAAPAQYIEVIGLIEELRYRLRQSIKAELDQHGIGLDAQQALMLFRVGDGEIRHSDWRTFGIYGGTNASYNQKRLHAAGYISHGRNKGDKREVRIRLTGKGKEVTAIMRGLFARQSELLDPAGADLKTFNLEMTRLTTMLVHQVAFRQ